MALKSKFGDLYNELKQLQDALFATRLTVSEDKPAHDEAALTDDLYELLVEVMGWVDACLTHSLAARQRVEPPVDLEAARHALSGCQERFRKAEHLFSARLTAYETFRELGRLAVQRGGEW